MAQKKNTSQAKKAVKDVKKSNSSSGKKSASSGKKTAPPPKPEDSRLSLRGLLAVISLGLFVLFLVTAIKADGALLRIIQSVLFGLIGKASFYFAIPALLYLFIIFAFSGKKPVQIRAISVIAFVLLCGCIFHLTVNDATFAVGGLGLIGEFYTDGLDGYSGGVLCGTVAALLRWACGGAISYILLGLAAALALLGAMNITIPSLIRAIRNRPRDEWEDEELEERPEPAAVVVNHIANKHIEQKRQRRERREQQANEVPVVVEEAPAEIAPKPEKKRPAYPNERVEAVMSQIDSDIEEPVAAAASYVEDAETSKLVAEEKQEEPQPVMEAPKSMKVAPPAPKTVEPEPEEEEELSPGGMPVFKKNAPLADAPKRRKTQSPAVEPVKEKVTAKDAAASAVAVAAEIAQAKTIQKPVYSFPPLDLLKQPGRAASDGTSEMRENSRRLNETLVSFKIDAHIINVTRGPSVTRYEVELDKGVRLNKLTGVADDIALSLGAPSVRIAPVPGRISVVGIEVPNRSVTNVHLREVIGSNEFRNSKSKSSFAVGKDIGGNCIVGNIAKMPHMLIAGTTGSGKSVCMNSIIISLLYKASPDDVKLIMVDPKMVELGIYNAIPHLLIPVVTDPKKAAGSLQWAVTEMMRRYKLMSDAGVRDLESFNSIVESQEEGERLPQVVIIIDELADLMLVAAKEVEDSICRIAQMGRAAGMHLIIATQRPSADVITGLMKANIPSRIAFAVASAMESRIILDTQGAEKLVGKGDMLYAPIGTGKPQRVQGCFVTDGEVEAVANFVKENYEASYDESIMEDIEKKAVQTGKKAAAAAEPEANAEELDGDEMLPAAVEVILETGQASVSMLQRRLKLGYARAARIVDEMEEKGIVGPFQGSKPRAILITKEQWDARNGGSAQMDFDDIPFDEGVPEEID